MIEVLLSSSYKSIKSIGESNIFNGIIAKGFSTKNENKLDIDFVKDQISNIFKERNYNLKDQTFY